MRRFISKSPVNHEVLAEFPFHSQEQLTTQISQLDEQYQFFKKYSIKDRATKLNKLSDLIENNASKYAKLITKEMGKPITQSLAEVKKSAAYCRYYANNAIKYLQLNRVKTEAKNSYYVYHPLGVVYVIGPFNFPFWLCFKPVIPSILLGNAILHRPSDSTPLVGLALEELFKEAGFDLFQNTFSETQHLDHILTNPLVHGVSFTGSSQAGRIIAGSAGKHLKRSVMELGGSDPFMLFSKGNVEKAVKVAMQSRVTNCGQVCFSAKRYLIHEKVYEEFKDKLCEELSKVQMGDPMLESTQLGPMAREDLVTQLERQLGQGVSEGAKVILGGSRGGNEGNFFELTVAECEKENYLLKHETFGPLFPLVKFSCDQEIVETANRTCYGLGACIITECEKQAKEMVNKLDIGMVFVNEVVKSDARLPSGGVKDSGFGRECCEFGVQNFANIKTVWIQ